MPRASVWRSSAWRSIWPPGCSPDGISRCSRSPATACSPPAGAQRLETLCAGLPRLWQHRLHREELVRLALVALHLLQPQRDYLVRQAQVHLIDPVTGRIAHGRMWSNGLQALVCLKEACPPPPPTETVARTTYSHFLRRYRLLGGTSATLHDPRQELRRLYGLAVTRVPAALPRRGASAGPNRWFVDEAGA